MPTITISSYDEAERLLLEKEWCHVISINDPTSLPPKTLENHNGRKLLLRFHDIPNPHPCFKCPTKADVRRIVLFAAGVSAGEGTLVHCYAGISRSSAAALTILASKVDRTTEGAAKALDHLLECAIRQVHPNRTMVQYADELLGFRGELFRIYAKRFHKIELPCDDLDNLMGITWDE